MNLLRIPSFSLPNPWFVFTTNTPESISNLTTVFWIWSFFSWAVFFRRLFWNTGFVHVQLQLCQARKLFVIWSFNFFSPIVFPIFQITVYKLTFLWWHLFMMTFLWRKFLVKRSESILYEIDVCFQRNKYRREIWVFWSEHSRKWEIYFVFCVTEHLRHMACSVIDGLRLFWFSQKIAHAHISGRQNKHKLKEKKRGK